MQQKKRKTRKAKIILTPEVVENMLRYRARGYSFQAIANIFKLDSRQEVSKLINDHKNEPKFAKLYEAIEETLAFLNRKI